MKEEKELETVVKGSKEMEKVAKKISKVSREEELQGIYDKEEQEQFIRNLIRSNAQSKGYEIGIEKGIEKGKYDEKKLIASNLLKQGVDVDIISKSSGLSKEEILNIKEEM